MQALLGSTEPSAVTDAGDDATSKTMTPCSEADGKRGRETVLEQSSSVIRARGPRFLLFIS
jgi:hypothetical protein